MHVKGLCILFHVIEFAKSLSCDESQNFRYEKSTKISAMFNYIKTVKIQHSIVEII